MKKVVFLVLALVLTFAMTMTCFADYVDYKVTFDHSSGLIGQSFNDDTIGNGTPWIEPDDTTTVNNIRINWTATRAIRDAGTVAEYVNIGTEAAPNIAVEIKGNEAMVNDYNAHTLGKDKFYFTIDMQAKKIGTFCGATFNATNANIGSGSKALPTDGGKYLQNTGFGFTLTGSNKVLLFVAGTAEANFDAQEMTLPFDATSAMHTYSMEVDFAAKKAEFYADNQLIGVFQAYGDDLFGIFNADGTPSADANDTNDGFNVAPGGTESNPNGANDGNVMFAVAGADSDVIIDNVYYGFDFPSHEPVIETADISLLNGIGGVGTWIRGPVGSYAAVAVNTLSEFYGFTIPVLWTSNPNNAGHGAIDMKIEVFTFNNTIEDSIGGTALYSVTKTYDHDMAEGDSFIFDNALSAGKYVIAFTQLTADGDGEVARYFVLPSAGAELAFDPFSTIYSGDKFNLILKLAKTDDGKYLDKVANVGSIIVTGSSDGDGGKAHQLTGHGPLAILTEIPAGAGIKGIKGHCPTWGDAGSGIVAQAYAWTGDYDSSIAGKIIATASIEGYAEAAQWATLTFDNVIPEGQYVILFTAGNEHHVGFWNAVSRSSAIVNVFKNGTESADYTPVMQFNYVANEVAPETEAPETEAPETEAPQTGDMAVSMFAVIAVAALAAVVVFKKRVNG